MRKILTGAALAAMTVLGSCSKSEVVVPVVTEDSAISFSTFIDQTTKGSIFDAGALMNSGFAITAFATEQTTFADADAIAPNFMYEQEVTYDGRWTYNPVKYWSNIYNDKYSFFAYAPYGSAEASANDYAGVPYVTFTIADEAADMVDFVAGQVIDQIQTDPSETVNFNLKHQLTRVSFSANTNITTDAYGADQTFVAVTGLKLVESASLFKSAKYTFATENTDDDETVHTQDGTWSDFTSFSGSMDVSSMLTYKSYDEEVYSAVNAPVGTYVSNTASSTPLFGDGYLFLIPEGSEGLSDDLLVEIEYQIVTFDGSLADGAAVAGEKKAVVTLPEGSLKQGIAYELVLTFDLEEVVVNAKVIDWSETDEIDDVTTGFDVPIFTVDLNAGDDSTLYLGLSEEEDATYTVVASFNDDLDIKGDIVYDGVVWTSSDESVATVDANGVVTPVAGGVATIRGTALAGGAYAECTVVIMSGITLAATQDMQYTDEYGYLLRTTAYNDFLDAQFSSAATPTNVADYYDVTWEIVEADSRFSVVDGAVAFSTEGLSVTEEVIFTATVRASVTAEDNGVTYTAETKVSAYFIAATEVSDVAVYYDGAPAQTMQTRLDQIIGGILEYDTEWYYGLQGDDYTTGFLGAKTYTSATSKTFTVEFASDETTNYTITWSSSNSNFVVVDGVVTYVGSLNNYFSFPSATITVTVTDDNYNTVFTDYVYVSYYPSEEKNTILI